MIMDTDATQASLAYEAVVLVGYVNTGTLSAAAGGVITL
jgi:hypothetical protein